MSPARAARYAAIVVDAESGQVLNAVNADKRNYPASLTKMMTLYLVFEALESGKLKLDQKLTVSAHAASMPPSNLRLRTGDKLTVKQAILALVTKSANDAAVVLAEALAGSETKFAAKMTRRAHAMGMKRTTFRNASGLPNRRQLSTARDMALLARRLIKDFPEEYSYFSTDEFTYDGRTYRNHNKLLESFPGTDGIKTGYIRASGYNLVASTKRNGRRLIGVVFGGKTSRARNHRMIKLLTDAFKSAPEVLVAADEKSASGGPERIQEASLTTTAEDVQSAALQSEQAADASGSWSIQVGAFSDPAPARAVAHAAEARLRKLARQGEIDITAVEIEGTALYRARIVGLSEVNARAACRYLKRRNMACMPIEPLAEGSSGQ